MRAATQAERAAWDRMVLANPDGGHYLQTSAWGEFKSHWRWRPAQLVSDTANGPVAMLFLRSLVAGLGTLWYCPKGPGIVAGTNLREVLPQPPPDRTAFLVKIDPEVAADADLSSWHAAGFVKAPYEVQSSSATIIVDLRPHEDAILDSFKSKTRYNIRLAARKGVVVRTYPVSGGTVDAMYRLMRATQARHTYTIRLRRYFDDAWRLLERDGHGQLFFATLGDEVLAGAFVAHLGRKAWYKDGGSSRGHAPLMAPYLLQWEVMRWLRDRGVESYDLVGVPRPAELGEGHPYHGLHRFKSGFNDRITEFAGTFNRALGPRRYALWNRAGERLARQWSARVHHDFYY